MLTPEDRAAIAGAFGVPLIRYEPTDRFTPAGISHDGWLRASVEGRSGDVFKSLGLAGVTEPRVTIRRAGAIARDPRTAKARRFIR